MLAIAAALGLFALGWLTADALSGVFHFWQDRHARGVLGELSRLHHVRPLAFTHKGALARNGEAWVAATAIGGGMLAIFGPSAFIFGLMAGGAASTQVHYFAHKPKEAPQWYRRLQQVGVVQSPSQHQRHHAPPHQGGFCVLTDYLNPLVDRLRAH